MYLYMRIYDSSLTWQYTQEAVHSLTLTHTRTYTHTPKQSQIKITLTCGCAFWAVCICALCSSAVCVPKVGPAPSASAPSGVPLASKARLKKLFPAPARPSIAITRLWAPLREVLDMFFRPSWFSIMFTVA
jgi:hypothetical protein